MSSLTRRLTRRQILAMAAAYGASLSQRAARAASRIPWQERRDLYPQGVASGDPQSDSVILWTRRPPAGDNIASTLKVEIAEDDTFRRLVANAEAQVSAATDWTCRVLVTDLKPARVYWYRFADTLGFGSRIGRTVTAPAENDSRPVSFAFVSCQNVQQGASTAYRRMIWEDRRKSPKERLGFVLHLGDFVYEIVWYPEDRPQGMYARRLRDIVRYAAGEKHRDFHVPTTLDDYRALYHAYLLDPDLQDARAYFPFVYMWDNHEFSWKGWQSQQYFGEGLIPAQTRKVAACQAWFEFQPARVIRVNSQTADQYIPPPVKDAAIDNFDANGLGMEPGNLEAIRSLKLYRTLRFGRNVELILTDNRSFRSQPVVDRPDFAPLRAKGFSQGASADVLEILDAGSPHHSMLGAEQKAWFFERLRASKAPWKMWGNSVAGLDWRMDFHNLPAEFPVKWPSAGYALIVSDDWSGYRSERAEILEFVRKAGIHGLAILAGDRHAFTAGVASSALPPKSFDPAAVEFVTGSISAPGLFEAMEHSMPKEDPLLPIFVHRNHDSVAQPAMNLSLMHGVRASLALNRTGDLQAALTETNPEVAPHLSFVDLGGHGYSVVRATTSEMTVEFVCIPRPVEAAEGEDGGALAYRVTHRAKLWKAGSKPELERTSHAGTFPLGSARG